MSLGGRRPITRPRSEYEAVDTPMIEEAMRRAGCEDVLVAVRPVHDGELRVIRSMDPVGPDGALEQHLSISHAPHAPRRGKRYPTWDEIADARDIFLPEDVEFRMILPKREEYVAVHDTTFHLHEHRRPE